MSGPYHTENAESGLGVDVVHCSIHSDTHKAGANAQCRDGSWCHSGIVGTSLHCTILRNRIDCVCTDNASTVIHVNASVVRCVTTEGEGASTHNSRCKCPQNTNNTKLPLTLAMISGTFTRRDVCPLETTTVSRMPQHFNSPQTLAFRPFRKEGGGWPQPTFPAWREGSGVWLAGKVW